MDFLCGMARWCTKEKLQLAGVYDRGPKLILAPNRLKE